VAERRTGSARPAVAAETANHGPIVASRSSRIATGPVVNLSPYETSRGRDVSISGQFV
jgi:hypothetical protein